MELGIRRSQIHKLPNERISGEPRVRIPRQIEISIPARTFGATYAATERRSSPREPEAPERPRGVVRGFQWAPGLTRILGAPSRVILVLRAVDTGAFSSKGGKDVNWCWFQLTSRWREGKSGVSLLGVSHCRFPLRDRINAPSWGTPDAGLGATCQWVVESPSLLAAAPPGRPHTPPV